MEINNVPGVRADINEMLSKIREVSSRTSVFSDSTVVAPTKNFESILSATKDVVSNVNDLQSKTEKVKNAYVTGDTSISMADVILSSQKSKLAFEGLVAVRNKILDAYKEIMNMPV